MQRRTLIFGAAAIAVVSLAAMMLRFGRPIIARVRVQLFGGRSIRDVDAVYGATARARLVPRFDSTGVAYPPNRVTFVALKRERRLEVWAESGGEGRRVHTYDICAASGVEGPKLREGDLQVPEGVYALTVLNPNSGFHLSIRVDYPNDFDREMASRDGRTKLGGDIYVHGNCVSIGCLAMGDPGIEELFILANDVDLTNMEIIVAPADLRDPSTPIATDGLPEWTPVLYDAIRQALTPFRLDDGLG